ncbi:S1 family peptidase [Streptomyces sp. NPDC057638]|uniref:S1 family peptidase n=1 Tax=Streptomyces sp. NPDC057638 TaxID=3346190 RepID=UPI00369F7619
MERSHSRRHRPRLGRLLTALVGVVVSATTVLAPNAAARAEAPPRAFTSAELTAVGTALGSTGVTGTAWSVDRASGTIQVLADESVTPAELTTLRRAAGDKAAALRIERVPGTFATRGPHGGSGLVDYLGRPCTLGFNVRIGGIWYWVGAGHCLRDIIGRYVYVRVWPPVPPPPDPWGIAERYSYPFNDYGLVRYVRPPTDTLGSIRLPNGQIQDITQAANATLGQSVCSVGSTTGQRCGRVTGLNYSLALPDGVIHGLTRTDTCSQAGDSGAPLYTGTTGLGVLSSGSGSCTTGGTSLFQPLVEILTAYGAAVY